jgi:hypothetical protein
VFSSLVKRGEGRFSNNLDTQLTSNHKTKTVKKVAKPRCGLCGKARNLLQTDCCGNWICNDEHKYVIFSYARNSCSRNHSRFTLCGYHHNEGHKGHWQNCKVCRKSFMTEMYVWYGTNECNFEKLESPPSYEPTHCSDCGKVISLGEDGYSQLGYQFWCEDCQMKKMRKINAPRKP